MDKVYLLVDTTEYDPDYDDPWGTVVGIYSDKKRAEEERWHLMQRHSDRSQKYTKEYRHETCWYSASVFVAEDYITN